MKIEKGKFYKLMNGLKAEIYAVHENYNIVHGVIYKGDGVITLAEWGLDGRAVPISQTIMMNWEEKHPAEDWPPGTIVEVSNDEKSWKLRRFVGVNKNLDPSISTYHFVTSEDGHPSLVSWRYVRLPK